MGEVGVVVDGLSAGRDQPVLDSTSSAPGGGQRARELGPWSTAIADRSRDRSGGQSEFVLWQSEETDQAELRDLMLRAGEASQEFSLGAAPQAIADEMAIVHEYKSDFSRNVDMTYVEAESDVLHYAGLHCDGLSLGADGSLQLDQSY